MAAAPKVKELDLIRTLSMLAVIMIHVTAPYVYSATDFPFLGMNLGFFLNQAARFAVPMFVLLSGASLGFSRSLGSLSGFYRKRALKIGLPYLLWFSVYQLYNIRHGLGPDPVTAKGLLVDFLMGRGAPHLYFIVVVAQCYLLYPLLKRAIRRAPRLTVALSLLCTGLIQLGYALELYGWYLIPGWIRPSLWILFPSWAVFFVLGMALTPPVLERLRAFAASHTGPLLLLALASVPAYGACSRITGSIESIKLTLDLYVPAILLGCFALWQLVGRFAWADRLTAFLSAHAMTVYFCHVLILMRLRQYGIFYHGMKSMMLLYLCTVLVSVPAAWILDTLGKRAWTALFPRKK